MAETIVVRADATARSGTGHVMRSLALAQAWQRLGGRAVFAQAANTPAIEARLRAEEMEVRGIEAPPGSPQDARLTAECARACGARWIVGDSYEQTGAWQAAIKQAGLLLLVWDDYGHAGHYEADLVLNQNLHASAAPYRRRSPDTRLLLGTRYVQLRDEFLQWRDWTRETPAAARKALVTLGGSDPDNITARVIEALEPLTGLEAVVVVGGSNPHREALQRSLRPNIRIELNPGNMPEWMAWADLAIAAGGGTAWELAWMGLPGIVVVLAENQSHVAAALEREELALNLGEPARWTPAAMRAAIGSLAGDAALRSRMTVRGRQVIDGLGADRVAARLLAGTLGLRRATEADCERIWQWASDPQTRAASFSGDPIPWEDHRPWYAARLASPACFLFVGLDAAGAPIGMVRFDAAGDEAAISVNLAPEARGRSLGGALIAKGVDEFFRVSSAGLVRAWIRPGNLASMRAFEKADFSPAAAATVHGQPALHYVITRP